MTRSIDPVPQWIKGGEPIALGEMYFFDTNSNTPKTTFADASEQTANPHPLILNANGELPNCFFSGLAKQILTFPSPFTQGDGRGEQVFNRDPVGQEIAIASFDTYEAGSTYQIHKIVTASDGTFHKSLINGNMGFNPLSDDGTHWERIEFNNFYAAGVTFNKNDSAISTVDGLTYISGVDSNKGNEPSANLDKWALDQPALPYVSDRLYAIAEKAISIVDKREYESQSAQSGNEPSANPAQWLPTDGLVSKPVNSAPSDSATDISKTPTLTTNAYAVLGSIAEFEWAQYEVLDSTETTVVYDSGIVRDTPSHNVTAVLDSATEYVFRVTHKGSRTNISTVSDTTTFTTTPDLSAVFAINSDSGTGSLRTTVTGVDLLAGSGSIWTKNRDTTGFIKRLDTARALNELDMAEETAQAVNANGLTQYLSSGFEVGTDAAYNGSGNTISSYTFKNAVGFHDTVSFTGDNLARNISHSLGIQAGAVIVKRTDSLDVGVSSFWMKSTGHSGSSSSGYKMEGGNNAGGTLGSLTSTTFGLGTSSNANDTGGTYTAEVFAHNPTQGIFCGSYVGTGSSLEIVTGFPVGLFICVSASPGGTRIVDIVTGTGSHILANTSGNVEIAGGVNSFNSNGITLGSNDLNASSDEYDFIAVADPNNF